jgi:hypothetical protein
MTDTAPVNVILHTPTNPPSNWIAQEKTWIKLNQSIGGHPSFYALTIKGAYMIGVIHTLCQSVSILLRDQTNVPITYLPAYGVFASGVELLGRCINGNSTTSKNTKDLKTGFKWLASKYLHTRSDFEKIPETTTLIKTTKHIFTIDNLVALRHFAAHGQATSSEIAPGSYQFGTIDFEILAQMKPLLAKGVDCYWESLKSDAALCDKLAQADVIPLRDLPVFTSWSLFEADENGIYHSVEEIFYRFDWQV